MRHFKAAGEEATKIGLRLKPNHHRQLLSKPVKRSVQHNMDLDILI